MSREVFEIVQGMDRHSIETQLALQCAPLIAGLKVSNLLIVSKQNEKLVREILRNSGIMCYRLLLDREKVTLLLFRRTELEFLLKKREIREVLAKNSYNSFSLGYVLCTFRERYEKHRKGGREFPHEMGLLLGYPVEDVVGFIEHQGKEYLYAGYWKVYANLPEKISLFAKYEAAKEAMIYLVSSGVGMREIIEIYEDEMQQKAAV